MLAPVCFALSNVVDNHVLHARLRDPISYNILATWPTLPVAVAIFFTWKVSFAFDAWFVGTAIGFAFAFLFILYNMAMMREQGTNVVSVLYVSPLFVAVLAAVFLGESLSFVNYVGIMLLVLSAFLVLYKRIDTKNLALGLILAYALGSAVARVAAKSALENVDVWSYFFWFLVGGLVGTGLLGVLWAKGLAGALGILDSRLTLLVLTTSGVSTIGLWLLYTAFSLGPVAIASGLTAIQPTLVFLYTIVLIRFRPDAIPHERVTGRWANVRKVVAVVLIVVGVFALTAA